MFTQRTELGDFLTTNWYAYALKRVGIAMPNCFTYACARISEIIEKKQPLDETPVRGAQDLWQQHAKEFTCQKYAKKGALMIWKGGNGNYGHVAVCEDLIDMNTIAWSQSNYGGSMFDYVKGNPNGYCGMQFLGYLYHQNLPEDQQLQSHEGKGTIRTSCRLNVRDQPALSGKVVAVYDLNQVINYDRTITGDGYEWKSYVAASGRRRYIAYRNLRTNEYYAVEEQNSIKKLYLPATITSWRVYPSKAKIVNGIIQGKECGVLNPSLYGGLQYDILDYPDKNFAHIKTQMFGDVLIYIGKETGAVIH